MLTHEWYIRDKRVDARPDSPGSWKLTTESSLMTLKIGVQGGPKIRDDWTATVVIPKRSCFDLSGHCLFWQSQGECNKNPNFMGEVCRLTCKLCESDEPKTFDGENATDNEEVDVPNEEVDEPDDGEEDKDGNLSEGEL